MALEARAAVDAGASSIHVHPKGASGTDSLDGADVSAWVEAVRAACPGVPVGVTTGAWATSDPTERVRLISAWGTLPDFASVNWHEDGAERVARPLLERGIGIEAGLWTREAAEGWARSRARDSCLRVLIEVQDVPAGEVRGEAEGILAVVRSAAPRVPVLLHGEGKSAWPALRLAARWGLDARIGLEDTLILPDGSTAAGNADLVAAAMRVAGAASKLREEAGERGADPEDAA